MAAGSPSTPTSSAPGGSSSESCAGEPVFFFSSRRRHTRSYGDWSSDVCSSDLGGYDVLNGYLGSVRLENRVLVGVFASGKQVAENEKVGDFSGRNQAHEIEVEVGPSGGGHVVVVVELRVGPVEVVLPDAAAHDRRFGRPLIRECHAGLQTSRPMRGTEGNCFAAHPCRNE